MTFNLKVVLKKWNKNSFLISRWLKQIELKQKKEHFKKVFRNVLNRLLSWKEAV